MTALIIVTATLVTLWMYNRGSEARYFNGLVDESLNVQKRIRELNTADVYGFMTEAERQERDNLQARLVYVQTYLGASNEEQSSAN